MGQAAEGPRSVALDALLAEATDGQRDSLYLTENPSIVRPGYVALCRPGDLPFWPDWVQPRVVDDSGDYRLLWAHDWNGLTASRVNGDPLKPFLALAEQEDARLPAQVQRFADKWGVLGLCPDHMLPATHNSTCQVQIWSPTWAGIEEIAAWKSYSRLFRNLLKAARLLHDEQQLPLQLAREAGLNDPYPLGDDIPGSQFRLAQLVTRLLCLAAVQVVFKWGRFDFQGSTGAAVQPHLVLGAGGTIFSALVLRLALAAARHNSEHIGLCANCGEAVTRHRRGRVGYRVFCDRPECTRASERMRKRDQRAGRRRWSRHGKEPQGG